MKSIYEKALEFKNRYPGTFGYRLKKHAKVIEDNLLEGEKVTNVYCGSLGTFDTAILAITNKRIILGHKKLFFGSKCVSINNDKICSVNAYNGMIWGKVIISSLSDDYFALYHLGKKASTKIQEGIIDRTIVQTVNEKQVKKTTHRPKKQVTKNISKQAQICRELNALYRERYNASTSESERQELRAKMLDNYTYYKSLTVDSEVPEDNPITLRLNKD
jgi:hypothetical protein